MKRISKNAATQKLAKLVEEKKIRKGSMVYGWINEVIEGKKEFRPVYSSGATWRFSALHDKSITFSIILGYMGIEYIKGNDAPRGGRTGLFIRIVTKITHP